MIRYIPTAVSNLFFNYYSKFTIKSSNGLDTSEIQQALRTLRSTQIGAKLSGNLSGRICVEEKTIRLKLLAKASLLENGEAIQLADYEEFAKKLISLLKEKHNYNIVLSLKLPKINYTQAQEYFVIANEEDSSFTSFALTDNNNPLFLKEVKQALQTLNSKEIGRRLLHSLPSLVRIIENDKDQAYENEGIVHLRLCSQHSLGKKGENIPLPFYIKLAHELIHILHRNNELKIHFFSACQKAIWTNAKEYCAIEGGSDTDSEITENNIRRAFNLPPRYTHKAMEGIRQHFRNLVQKYARQLPCKIN